MQINGKYLIILDSDISIEFKNINGTNYMDFRIFTAILKNFRNINMFLEVKKISKENYFKENDRKKIVRYWINSSGLMEYLSKSLFLGNFEKDYILNRCKEIGFIDGKMQVFFSRKELDFISDFHRIAKYFNIKIEKQKECCGYLIDMVINNSIAIEYDENNHINYNPELETKREEIIKKYYKLIRVSCKKTNIENIEIILDYIIKNKGDIKQ